LDRRMVCSLPCDMRVIFCETYLQVGLFCAGISRFICLP
jgi:hypothetical protein